MRRVLGFTMIFSGTIVCIFIFNILLYALVPGYRGLLIDAVYNDDIPVVEASADPVVIIEPDTEVQTTSKVSSEVNLSDTNIFKEKESEDEQISVNEEKQLQVIDKTYHEDCGTGEGYWVITYSDGSVELE